MFNNYLGDYINVMQVAHMKKDKGMTPKAIIRLAAENKLKAYVEGHFELDGEPVEPYQRVMTKVLYDVLAQYDENLDKKYPEKETFDFKDCKPPPFGPEIIDIEESEEGETDIDLVSLGVTGFFPKDFLLKVRDLQAIIESERYQPSQKNSKKLEKDNAILVASLAETLNTIAQGNWEIFIEGGDVKIGRLSKLLDTNIMNHTNLITDTGDRLPGTSEAAIRRALASVTKELESMNKVH